MAELHGTRDLDAILMTIYWFVDDFLASSLRMLNPAIESPRITNKNPPVKQRKLRLSEIVTLGIFRFYVGTTNWKDFYWHRDATPLEEPKFADSSKLKLCEIKRKFSH